MRRGFKADAERRSVQIREDLGLRPFDTLSMDLLADHLGAEVRSADDLIDVRRLQQIDDLQPGAFSACTFEIGKRRVIVWNPLSTAARIRSDIAHELAHLDLKHKVQEIKTVGDFAFFGCDADEEQEANWQAGCFLLPRPLLIAELRAGTSVAGIADRHHVSLQMAQYRVRATGVQRQFSGR